MNRIIHRPLQNVNAEFGAVQQRQLYDLWLISCDLSASQLSLFISPNKRAVVLNNHSLNTLRPATKHNSTEAVRVALQSI
jgi:hypothetical protein